MTHENAFIITIESTISNTIVVYRYVGYRLLCEKLELFSNKLLLITY